MVDRRRVISHPGSRINIHPRQGIRQDRSQADYQREDSSTKGREEGCEEVGSSQEEDSSPEGREEGREEVGSSQEEDSSPEGREEGREEVGSSQEEDSSPEGREEADSNWQAPCQEGG